MILILCEHNTEVMAQAIADDLQQAYGHRLGIQILPAAGAVTLPQERSWDDLLIVIFRDTPFPARAVAFIEEYRKPDHGFIMPVALSSEHIIPPDLISGIKAIKYDKEAKGPSGRISRRIGAMLGLRLRRRQSKIFISYRVIDGSGIAQNLHRHLEENGFTPWLDEAKDDNGEGKIMGGEDVQTIIEEKLRDADMLLLIDTPKAAESYWIRQEIHIANAELIPILPVLCRAVDDRRRGPRFSLLNALKRWVEVDLHPPAATEPPLQAGELQNILAEMEAYLCEIYRRKLRVPYLVRNQFLSHGYSWEDIDLKRHVYESNKAFDSLIKRHVISHCSMFDEIYAPALRFFSDYNCGGPRENFRLFIYDGEVLPENEINDLSIDQCPSNLVILHHQELAILLSSNFTRRYE